MAEKHPPIGTIIAYAGNFTPDLHTWETNNEWMLCNGRPLNRTDPNYVGLFNAVGSSWGGDGANMFNLPDIRGYFLRGVSGDSGKDPNVNDRRIIKTGGHSGNDVGSIQDDMMQSHKHTDSGHGHGASTSISGQIQTHFGEEVEDGSGSLVDGNEGNQGNYDPGFAATTTIAPGSANLGDPVGSTAGAPRIGQETRPINAYVHWIIRWK